MLHQVKLWAAWGYNGNRHNYSLLKTRILVVATHTDMLNIIYCYDTLCDNTGRLELSSPRRNQCTSLKINELHCGIMKLHLQRAPKREWFATLWASWSYTKIRTTNYSFEFNLCYSIPLQLYLCHIASLCCYSIPLTRLLVVPRRGGAC